MDSEEVTPSVRAVSLAWSEIESLDAYFARVRAEDRPYTVPVLGHDVIVLPPHVMSPAFDGGGHQMIDVMATRMAQGSRVLDIGSGCGILSVAAWVLGAAHVTAIDINPHAVLNTRQNYQKHGITGFVLEGDAFAALPQDALPFDLILFHAPYFDGTPTNWLEAGAFDPGYTTLRRVILNAHRHLAPDGELLVCFCENEGDIGAFDRLISESGLIERERLRKPLAGLDLVLVTAGFGPLA